MDAFISYSSSDRALAARLDRVLRAESISVWHDVSEIRLGELLGDELRTAILGCRAFVLLWSEHAQKSRWVNCEWLMALHQSRFIVPCTLDDTLLPQCLQTSVFQPLHRVTEDVVRPLVRAIRNAEGKTTPLAPVPRGESPELKSAIADLADGQQMMTDALGSDLDRAAQIQAVLDPAMKAARAAWPLDAMIINLDGFHLKNAYMLEHWGAIQAGRAPDDPVLDQAERRFYETLAIDPTDPSALNGLGSVLFFKRDLNAAEFFQRAAIEAARRRRRDYPAAQRDLEMVLRFKAEQQAVVAHARPG